VYVERVSQAVTQVRPAQVVAAQRAWRGAVAVRRAQAGLLAAQLSGLEAEVWRAQQAAARGGEPGPDAPPPAWGAFAARGAAVAAVRRERGAGTRCRPETRRGHCMRCQGLSRQSAVASQRTCCFSLVVFLSKALTRDVVRERGTLVRRTRD